MIAEDQPVFGADLCHLLRKTFEQLVVAVHPVHLHPLHAHLRIMGEHLSQAPLQLAERRPYQHPHAPLRRVFDEVRNIHDRLHGVDALRPAKVQHDVFQPEVAGEVDEVFVRTVVAPRAEIDACDVEAVPPVGRHLSRLDP